MISKDEKNKTLKSEDLSKPNKVSSLRRSISPTKWSFNSSANYSSPSTKSISLNLHLTPLIKESLLPGSQTYLKCMSALNSTKHCSIWMSFTTKTVLFFHRTDSNILHLLTSPIWSTKSNSSMEKSLSRYSSCSPLSFSFSKFRIIQQLKVNKPKIPWLHFTANWQYLFVNDKGDYTRTQQNRRFNN